MIPVTDDIALDENELQFEFVRSSGPGGQHVNKSATAVQLRFDAAQSSCLPEAVRARLMAIAGRRLTDEGELVIEARRFRSQDRNRKDAVDRLVRLIQRAAKKPKPRRRTKPSKAAKARRVDEKRRRGERKRLRGSVRPPKEE